MTFRTSRILYHIDLWQRTVHCTTVNCKRSVIIFLYLTPIRLVHFFLVLYCVCISTLVVRSMLKPWEAWVDPFQISLTVCWLCSYAVQLFSIHEYWEVTGTCGWFQRGGCIEVQQWAEHWELTSNAIRPAVRSSSSCGFGINFVIFKFCNKMWWTLFQYM